MVSYNLNVQAVREADKSRRIDASGKYVGVFTRVEPYKTDNGADAIGFDFKSEDGDANFVIYMTDNEGNPAFGANQFNALMAVFRLKSAESKKMLIDKYDFDEKKTLKIEVEVLPDMMSRQIGVLLQRETYTKKDGKDGYRFNLFSSFSPESELSGSEILEGKTVPEVLYKRIKSLKDKDGRKGTQYTPAAQPNHPAFQDIPL